MATRSLAPRLTDIIERKQQQIAEERGGGAQDGGSGRRRQGNPSVALTEERLLS
jgi:hypothetical protein